MGEPVQRNIRVDDETWAAVQEVWRQWGQFQSEGAVRLFKLISGEESKAVSAATGIPPDEVLRRLINLLHRSDDETRLLMLGVGSGDFQEKLAARILDMSKIPPRGGVAGKIDPAAPVNRARAAKTIPTSRTKPAR